MTAQILSLSQTDETEPKRPAKIRPPAKMQGVRIPGAQFGVDLQVNLNFGDTVWEPDYALRLDAQYYDRIERDEVVAHAMQYLRTTVAGNGQTFIASDNKYDPLIPYFEAFVSNIYHWQESKRNICYAVLRGTHAARIVGSIHRDLALVYGDKPRSWYMVDELQDCDKRALRIEYDRLSESEPDSEDNRSYYYTVLDPVNGQWTKLDRRDYVIWVYNNIQASALFGFGLCTPAYISVYSKNQLRDILLNAYEAYGTGIKVGKIDHTVGDGLNDSGGRYTPAERAADLYESLSELYRTGYSCVINACDDIDIKWSQPGMFESLNRAIQHEEDNIRILLLGSNVLGETNSGGSRARSETQSRLGDRAVWSYREEMDDVYENQLFQRWWATNRPNWESMGLWTPRCPIKVQTNKFVDYDADQELKNIVTLRNDLELPLYKRQVYERAGYTMPDLSVDDQEELLLPPTVKPGEGEGMKPVENAEGESVAGGEPVAAAGFDPLTVQEASLALERSIKNKDRLSASIWRRKALAMAGEDPRSVPDIDDAEWQDMTADQSAQAPGTRR